MKYLSALFFLFFCGGILAEIDVSPMILNFSYDGDKKQDIRVYNPGDDVEYVQITPTLTLNPGTKNEVDKKIPDPRELGVLISPNKLILPAKQATFVRVSLLKKCDNQEHFYNIVFSPVLGKLVTEDNKQKGYKVGLKIVVAYAVSVSVSPCHPNININLKRDGNMLTIVNNGNVKVSLAYGKQCISKTKCASLPYYPLFAGKTWQLKLPYSAPVSFQQIYQYETQNIVSN
jgi:hypothetical protein